MKRVLITGGASGLGLCIAKVFLDFNYDVTITYNTSFESAKKIKETTDIKAIKCDISNEEDIHSLFLSNRYDLVINNASVSLDDEILNKTKEDFMRVLEVNLVGTFMICKEAIRNGVSDIINISSTDSIDTYQCLNVDYSCSKAGVNILGKTIALAYPNIRIITVLPNWINTNSVLEMNQEYLHDEMKRIGQSKLLDKEKVAKKILNIYESKSIKSGELIRIDEGDLNV